jgi:predicted ribosomally synthesized peptide with nif11-like leader
MEQIKAMLDEMSKSGDFAGEMQALINGGNTAAIITAAGKKGFAFTEADWQAFLDWGKSMTGENQSKELSPDELERVSGGGTIWDPDTDRCWFFNGNVYAWDKNNVRRKQCKQFACMARDFKGGWGRCSCHGTDRCVGNWHLVYAPECKEN